MKRFTARLQVAVGGAILLMALILALALPGIAAAARHGIVPRGDVPDVTAPVTIDNSASATSCYFKLVFTADDGLGGSGVDATYYSIDGGAWTQGTSVMIRREVRHKLGGLAVGSHTIDYYSVDLLGNAEAVESIMVTINPPIAG